jgi:hypothetical protein
MSKSIDEVKTDTISVELFAEIMEISRNSAYAAVKKGDVPAITLGRLKRIPTHWVRERLRGGAASAAA